MSQKPNIKTPGGRGAPATDASLNRVLDSGERLMGELGLDAVPLQQIGFDAGEADISILVDRFGGKVGLVRAIIKRRLEDCEKQRWELLEVAALGGVQASIRTLVEILVLPIAAINETNGQHVYARFLLQFYTHATYQRELRNLGWEDPGTLLITGQLEEQLPFLSPIDLGRRIKMAVFLFLCALVDRDNALAHERPVEAEDIFFRNIYAMMGGAIQAQP